MSLKEGVMTTDVTNGAVLTDMFVTGVVVALSVNTGIVDGVTLSSE